MEAPLNQEATLVLEAPLNQEVTLVLETPPHQEAPLELETALHREAPLTRRARKVMRLATLCMNRQCCCLPLHTAVRLTLAVDSVQV